jgi:hypothetical protein
MAATLLSVAKIMSNRRKQCPSARDALIRYADYQLSVLIFFAAVFLSDDNLSLLLPDTGL